jgi:hypothetical protein
MKIRFAVENVILAELRIRILKENEVYKKKLKYKGVGA